jgi:Spy/CpxP family protein refolding chaperone
MTGVNLAANKNMKLNKTVTLAALVVGGFFTVGAMVQAQDSTNLPPAVAPGGLHQRGPNFDGVAKQLNLTDDQKPKVKAILEDQQKKAQALGADKTLSIKDKLAQRKELHDATGAQLKEILTADQYAKWEKLGQLRRRPAPTLQTPTASATNAPAAN